MKIEVNGEPMELENPISVDVLLQEMDATESRVSVVVNEEVIPAERRSGVILQEGDQVEILVFAAGG
jgi:sulfur carrier protein